MLLKNQMPCRQWGSCDVGKRAHSSAAHQYEDANVWPLEIIAAPVGYFPGNVNSRGTSIRVVASYENWEWRVFLNMGQNRSSSSTHKTFRVCTDHSKMLKQEWEQIMRLEVTEHEAWWHWIERVES